ncbi:MAG: PrsW family glutamic-type intramembrane protease [Patescibacteria group bacterium]
MLNLLFFIALSTLPVALLLYYYWIKDHGEKEPLPLMKKVFWHGVLIVIPVGIVEYFLLIGLQLLGIENGTIAYGFLVPFFLVAIPEELGKLYVVKKYAFDHPKFNELMDGITYCIIASMGFAFAENISYIFLYGSSAGILRFFTAIPAHALFSGLMGFYIGRAKFDKKNEKELIQRGLFYGVFFHGFYDFLLMSGVPLLILSVFPLLIYMWWKLNKEIKLVQKE